MTWANLKRHISALSHKGGRADGGQKRAGLSPSVFVSPYSPIKAHSIPSPVFPVPLPFPAVPLPSRAVYSPFPCMTHSRPSPVPPSPSSLAPSPCRFKIAPFPPIVARLAVAPCRLAHIQTGGTDPHRIGYNLTGGRTDGTAYTRHNSRRANVWRQGFLGMNME